MPLTANTHTAASVAVVLSADEVVSERVAYWLNAAGIRASLARTGYEARSLIQDGATRLLITDRVLPPWPGLDTVIALKRAIPGLKVAYLGDGVPDTRTLAISAGADLILPSPLRRADVLDAAATADPKYRGFACAS